MTPCRSSGTPGGSPVERSRDEQHVAWDVAPADPARCTAADVLLVVEVLSAGTVRTDRVKLTARTSGRLDVTSPVDVTIDLTGLLSRRRR